MAQHLPPEASKVKAIHNDYEMNLRLELSGVYWTKDYRSRIYKNGFPCTVSYFDLDLPVGHMSMSYKRCCYMYNKDGCMPYINLFKLMCVWHSVCVCVWGGSVIL